MSVLAATAAIIQPKAGRALDTGRLTTRTGLLTGLLITAAGLAAAMVPGLPGVLLAAALIGAYTGLITPLGFAALTAYSYAAQAVLLAAGGLLALANRRRAEPTPS
ncbi:hypothetical protein ACIQI8_41540 [Streptomyces sp. NPDC092369]|uniref:hypothetical protein n=1 Tax=Streptomyces sp. NPDC092369 TaxID=3366015 RepID=UPI0037F6491D